MRRPITSSWRALLLLAALSPARADAAPEPGPRELHVLHLASLRQDDYAAIRLTKALEQRAISSGELRLVNSNQALLVLLERARCGSTLRQSAYAAGSTGLDERTGQSVDAECLNKLAAQLGTPAAPASEFLWGYVHRDARGQLYATLHRFRRGEPDRHLTLPVDERAPAEALADRLFRHLLEPERASDVRLEGPAGAGGELRVDGRERGAFRPGDEFTLDPGEHTFELFRGGARAASTRARLKAGAMTVVRLEPAGASSRAAGPAPRAAEPGADAAPGGPSALPWVLGGVGAAGLGGAIAFSLLRRDAERDLERRCVSGQWCFPEQQSMIDRSERYATLAAVSLGVGAAGLGAGLWLLVSRPKAPATAARATGVTGALYPVAGGGAAVLEGGF
ncbi:MAG TPA: hypothetical protein VFS43_13080 [Polyangiaceae bacterium]|nr:hypothetical protein [Polyangiaceae bacterium]